MTRPSPKAVPPSPRTAPRRTAGSLAVGLLAAGSLAFGAPARADGPVLTLGGPAETALHPYPASGAPQKATLGLTVDNPDADDAEGDSFEGDATYTVDLSGVAGLADVAVAEDTGADCEITGATAVCHGHGVHAGLGGIADFDLTAAKGAEEGASGVIRVTGTARGATFTPFSTKVTVGGPDLVMRRLPFERQLKPGDVQPAPITFTNKGTRAADGVLLTLKYSRGLDIPERYANCVYDAEAGDDPRNAFAWSTALCSVEGSYEPGATYTLGVPLSVGATERAYDDTFVYRIDEDGAARRPALRSGGPSTRGAGPELTLRKATAKALRADLEPGDNQQEADFHTEHTADFAAYGAEAGGAEGDTVTAEVGFRNEGPAWISNLRSGEPVATLDVTVPAGAEVTGKPDSCQGVTAAGRYREEQLGAPRYLCDTSTTVRDGADIGLRFELEIGEVVPDASGAVTVRNTSPGEPALPFDPREGDNTARIVLNPTGSGPGSGSGSGDTGGTSAGGSTGGDTPGSTSASGSAGPAASTGASGTSGSSSAGTGGVLASTGSAAPAAAAAAAAALLAGGVLLITARRRAGRG